jgi:galactokinase
LPDSGAIEPTFDALFGRSPAVRREAPGRVNLIGEHTDYNEGFVCPIATPHTTFVDLAPRPGRIVRLWSANVAVERRHAEFCLGDEGRRWSWEDYVQGVTAAMRRRGLALGGFDARFSSTVPLGAGLSSSASFEIALVRGLTAAFALPLDAVDAARIGHEAETGLVGAPVGMMDQMAASLATTQAALFLDARTLAFEHVQLPTDAELAVIHSGIPHNHAGGEYRVRRQECTEAAQRLGVEALRDVTLEQLEAATLAPPLDRRARHVVTENARVLAARDAMRAGDSPRLGSLMNGSHDSMRDDFEVSLPEIDALVNLGQREPSVFGARMTGGGFGGSIVVLVRRGLAGPVARRICAAYHAEGRGGASILIPL